MRIHHLTSTDNVDAEGLLIDPHQVRHAVVVAGRVGDLAGPIDPLTHLNLDFFEHRLEECLVAERLERGAPVRWDGDHFFGARVRPSDYLRLGPVDVHVRRRLWQGHLPWKS